MRRRLILWQPVAIFGRDTMDGTAQAVVGTMLDHAPYPTPHRISSTHITDNLVHLAWSDGRNSRFHAMWLRDNCPCPVCRHPHALERRFLLIDQREPPHVVAATVENSGDLTVTFAAVNDSAGHVSVFDAGWLRHHCYQDWARAERAHEPKLWGAWLEEELPIIEYQRFTHSDEGVLDWINGLLDYGIVLLTGAPAKAGQIQHIADRVGPIRYTNFGSIFDVISKPNPNASADTPMGLELHHDLPNWRYPPDIQLLFCVANDAAGGGSVYADSFKIAADLRVEEPEVFERLSRQIFEFRFHDENCDHHARAPMIELAPDGRVTRVRFNNWLRAPFDIPENEVEPTYDSLRRFWLRLRDPRYQLRRKLDPGEMIAVANARVMHGRDPFDPSTGHRHMQGCLMDMDWVLSTRRLIERRKRPRLHV